MMISIKNYDLFVDCRTAKSGKTYYGLYIKIGDTEQLLTFIQKTMYDYISSLSK